MTRQELRVFLQAKFCGCGDPALAAGAMLRLLRLHPLNERAHRAELEAWLPDEGARYLVLYALDRKLDRNGAWLLPKGVEILDALTREESDGFEALLSEHCSHGYDFDDGAHDCVAAEAERVAAAREETL